MGPYAGADYITSTYLIVDFKVQAFNPNDDKCQMIPNYSKKLNNQDEKGIRGSGREGLEAGFIS